MSTLGGRSGPPSRHNISQAGHICEYCASTVYIANVLPGTTKLCICVFAFVYLYLCICVFVFVFFFGIHVLDVKAGLHYTGAEHLSGWSLLCLQGARSGRRLDTFTSRSQFPFLIVHSVLYFVFLYFSMRVLI